MILNYVIATIQATKTTASAKLICYKRKQLAIMQAHIKIIYAEGLMALVAYVNY